MTKKEVFDMELLVNNMTNEDLKIVQKAAIAEMETLEESIKSLQNRVERLKEKITVIEFIVTEGEA